MASRDEHSCSFLFDPTNSTIREDVSGLPGRSLWTPCGRTDSSGLYDVQTRCCDLSERIDIDGVNSWNSRSVLRAVAQSIRVAKTAAQSFPRDFLGPKLIRPDHPGPRTRVRVRLLQPVSGLDRQLPPAYQPAAS